jgi:hypothetical protein
MFLPTMFKLLALFVIVEAAPFKSYITDGAYHFKVYDSWARASISEGRHLVVKTPKWSRKWALPSDSDITEARTFRNKDQMDIIVPRFKMPELVGGDVERGKVIKIYNKDICSTFDGTTPICGTPCSNGIPLQEFKIDKDEVIIKLKHCKSSLPIKTIIYNAYDNDIIVEDIGNEQIPAIHGKYGWFDRHGNERAY